jgi:hypothetical protein
LPVPVASCQRESTEKGSEKFFKHDAMSLCREP